ncbi:pectinesterase inhibitor 3 [Salvia hispanica]|uniref:pectinesterase inhibitor 3 n=1 Tax=Salvia hispanica TaxID=49212 RepID=UPI0020099F63|nr:pectinesterase inhibitor 3 [Salvia hispanica]
MPTPPPPLLLSLLLTLLISSAAASPKHDLVRRSCVHASYPDVCLRTLSSSSSSGAAATPRDLAQAAVRVSLAHVRKAAEYLAALRGSVARREQGALGDCVEQMADTVDELRKTMAALRQLRRGGGGAEFRWQMSNAETWVSAALTDEETCLDGFKEIGGEVRADVRKKVTNVARVTSNALYLINLLDD